MLNSKQLDKIMFFAIETVPMVKTFNDLSPKMQECFKQRFKHEIEQSKAADELVEYFVFQEKAALHPEFGRIASISWGGFGDMITYPIKQNGSADIDEKIILSAFVDKISKIAHKQGSWEFSLCGFSAKGFNIPFLVKRLLINRMEIPKIIDMENLKPWEISHVIDLSAEWKMGAYESYVSMETLCEIFGVQTKLLPHDEITKLFYSDNVADVQRDCDNKLTSLINLYLNIKNIKYGSN